MQFSGTKAKQSQQILAQKLHFAEEELTFNERLCILGFAPFSNRLRLSVGKS